MDLEMKEEFCKVHARLDRSDDNFVRIEEKFERIDQTFGVIHQKLAGIEGDLHQVHASFNLIYSELLHKRRCTEEMSADIKKILEIVSGRCRLNNAAF